MNLRSSRNLLGNYLLVGVHLLKDYLEDLGISRSYCLIQFFRINKSNTEGNLKINQIEYEHYLNNLEIWLSLKDLTRLELLISFICVYLILLTGFLGIIVLRVVGVVVVERETVHEQGGLDVFPFLSYLCSWDSLCCCILFYVILFYHYLIN